uniref:Uncharacterized protein n=1 Tax=Bradyrhizobium ottawaense TaxID=931866 RepID=A0A2U8P361_9BRAD|nr:hypothetical protein CIT37_07815 [Bradyrhizobium ottawaense]
MQLISPLVLEQGLRLLINKSIKLSERSLNQARRATTLLSRGMQDGFSRRAAQHGRHLVSVQQCTAALYQPTQI